MINKELGRSNNVIKNYISQQECKKSFFQKLPETCVRAEKMGVRLVMYFKTQHDAENYFKTL